jgi:hypothetical protein
VALAEHEADTIRTLRLIRLHVENIKVEDRQQVDHGHLPADVAGTRLDDCLEIAVPYLVRNLGTFLGGHIDPMHE